MDRERSGLCEVLSDYLRDRPAAKVLTAQKQNKETEGAKKLHKKGEGEHGLKYGQ